jgi:hypothetical protein
MVRESGVGKIAVPLDTGIVDDDVVGHGTMGSYAASMVVKLMNECGDKGRSIIVKATRSRLLISSLTTCVSTNSAVVSKLKDAAPKQSTGVQRRA